jgi:hypothetical protein
MESSGFKVPVQHSVVRMQVNDDKAGMQNLDKEKINAIILKHSQSWNKKKQILLNA